MKLGSVVKREFSVSCHEARHIGLGPPLRKAPSVAPEALTTSLSSPRDFGLVACPKSYSRASHQSRRGCVTCCSCLGSTEGMEKHRVSADRVAEDRRRIEVQLIGSLSKTENHGVIGVRARGRLQRLPSAVYWGCLCCWSPPPRKRGAGMTVWVEFCVKCLLCATFHRKMGL